MGKFIDFINSLFFWRKKSEEEQREDIEIKEEVKEVKEEKVKELAKIDDNLVIVKKLHNRSFESLPGEVWKDIPDNIQYEVSNMGRVYSKLTDICLRTYKDGDIYLYRQNSNKRQSKNVARMVAELFLPIPQADYRKYVVMQRVKGDDFSVSNLYWMKRKDYLAQKRGAKIENVEEIKVDDVDDVEPIPVSDDVEEYRVERVETFEEESFKSIVQLRLNGEYVRRYEDVNEILDVHKTYERDVISECLAGFIKDAYGWKWVYEVDYEKN